MSSDVSWTYDSARTFRGRLQRGLGKAAYRARFDPAAGDLVWECLRRDHRWDWQVDDRDVYLARLVRDLHLDIAGLDRQLRACGPGGSHDEPDPNDVDNQFDLAQGVLTTLALGGDPDARTLLRAYVRDGPRWADTLTTISHSWPRDWWDDLWEVAAERLEPSTVFPHERPWESWRGRDARIDAMCGSWPVRAARRRQCFADLSTDRLLTLLTDADRPKALAVLRTLRRREPAPQLLSILDRIDLSLPLHSVLRALGDIALGHARGWARDHGHPLAWTGMTILAEHGGEEDVEQLFRSVEWLRSRDGDLCGFDTLTAGLARILGPGTSAAHTEAVRVTGRLLTTSPHSYERAAYLRSLLILDRDRVTGLLPTCLLDCEPGVRLLAAEHVDSGSPLAQQLLAELRDDALENAEVRAAAGVRLASDTPHVP
ncbi:hypothetical protein [Hamadaea tsunoensis]|uniref:hypothetical protein n=1 Tax=Hamadaea tsunoensis TaxID=53368 RepID=UPI000405A1E6|nr:hypothetical protein [Hamadaea tsunoensis]